MGAQTRPAPRAKAPGGLCRAGAARRRGSRRRRLVTTEDAGEAMTLSRTRLRPRSHRTTASTGDAAGTRDRRATSAAAQDARRTYALPHPVLTIDGDRPDHERQRGSETFFQMSRPQLARATCSDILPFGSPVLARRSGRERRRACQRIPASTSARRASGLNGLSTSMPRRSAMMLEGIVMMLQERTIADKMDRQLTHRGAARSVTALGAMLAHEIKNPLSGIRGAAQLLETGTDRRGPRTDPADLRRDRPDREAGRPDGGVLRRAARRARERQHP